MSETIAPDCGPDEMLAVSRQFAVAAMLLLCACAEPLDQQEPAGSDVSLIAETWEEADALFFNNPKSPQWKGADVANSVLLGEKRIMWVFGDTLLTETDVNRCRRFDEFQIKVHNSLAIQQGTDPTQAEIQHFWGQTASGQPASFFSPGGPGESWYWMGGVTVIGDHTLVFLMHARPVDSATPVPDTSCAGLDFEMQGWEARIAKITPATPDKWAWRELRLPQDNYWQKILVGSSTVRVEGDFLYAWSAGPASLSGNPIYLARWPLSEAVSGNLSDPQWHTETGWLSQTSLGHKSPTAIVHDGNNEISVARSPFESTATPWLWLQSSQVINGSLCYRLGESPVKFGECKVFLTPPELAKYPGSELLVYAVKLHPVLSSGEDNAIVGTYVVNSCNLTEIQDGCDLYYPRFIKLRRQP